MYTILMNEEKRLITTIRSYLYQKEKLVDKIQFIFPLIYGEENLSEYEIVLKYLDQKNIPHSEILTIDTTEFPYKENYFRCFLPVDTNLSEYAGDINISFSLTRVDIDTRKQYVLHTSDVSITISPVKDLYGFVPDKSLQFVDQMVGNLEAKMEALEIMNGVYSDKLPDDLVKVKDNNNNDVLKLSVNGEPTGHGVIVNGSESDVELDGINDGVLNLDLIEL